MTGRLGISTFGAPFVSWDGGRTEQVTGFTAWPDGDMQVRTKLGSYKVVPAYGRAQVQR